MVLNSSEAIREILDLEEFWNILDLEEFLDLEAVFLVSMCFNTRLFRNSKTFNRYVGLTQEVTKTGSNR
jgi:hypothetical protein